MIVLALLIAAAAPLQPLSFLAGHCFKGPVSATDVDEHCFTWAQQGKALRDVHTVRGPSHPDFTGETLYYWDSAQNRIEYLYVESAGGIMRGTVVPESGALAFPSTAFVADGKAMTLRTRWTLFDGGYEAFCEVQANGGWTTLFKVRMTRSS
jgi:hypothetical protein